MFDSKASLRAPAPRAGRASKRSFRGQCLSTWQILFVLALCVQIYVFSGRNGHDSALSSRLSMRPERQTLAAQHADGQVANLGGRKGEKLGRKDVHGAGDAKPGDKIVDEDLNAEDPSGGVATEDREEQSMASIGSARSKGQVSSFPPIPDTCTIEVIGGREKDGYGAWTLCGDRLKPGGVVYSFGIGGDVSFDNDLVERGLTVHGFDPTIDEVKVKNVFRTHHHKDEIPRGFIFKQLGLAATDGVVTFFQSRNSKIHSKTAVALTDLKANYRDGGLQAAVLRFKTFMCMLGHTWVDVLKMDVEGVEMDICLSDDFRNWPIPADQILIEFHERMMKGGTAKKVECMSILRSKGYRPVHISVNKQEIAFARMKESSKVHNPKHV